MAPLAKLPGVAPLAALTIFLLLMTCSAGGTFPLFILYFVNYKLYRKGVAFLVAKWHCYVAFLLETVYGIDFVTYGDSMEGGASIMISNHRTRLDWMFLWPLLSRYDVLHYLRIALKADLKKLPFFGWTIQQSRYTFLNRRWEEDKAHMTCMLNVMAAFKDDPYSLLIFPEGTDLRPAAVEKSNGFAKAAGKPEFQYVLHPRTTGFIHALEQLRLAQNKLETVYDITLAYEGSIPQNEKVIVTGQMPRRVHCLVKKFKAEELPKEQEALAEWLWQRFAEKERMLGAFYRAEEEAKAAGKKVELRLTADAAASAPAMLAAGASPAELKTADSARKPVEPKKAALPWASYARCLAFMASHSLLICSLLQKQTLLICVYLAIYFLFNAVICPKVFGGLDKLEVRMHAPKALLKIADDEAKARKAKAAAEAAAGGAPAADKKQQ